MCDQKISLIFKSDKEILKQRLLEENKKRAAALLNNILANHFPAVETSKKVICDDSTDGFSI